MSQNVPPGHVRHVASPTRANWPWPQGTHAVLASFGTDPARQVAGCAVRASGQMLPGGHGRQAAEPSGE